MKAQVEVSISKKPQDIKIVSSEQASVESFKPLYPLLEKPADLPSGKMFQFFPPLEDQKGSR